MGTASQALAEFVSALRYDDLPPGVVRAAKRHLLDTAGVTLAATASGVGLATAEMTRSWAGAREASIIGFDFGAPAPFAALVNGTHAHALDFDDTHVEAVLHPSAVVFPAALAVAEETGARGADLITAAVAGYEVAARVGAAAPGRFDARGLDATGIAGTFAATAAAGRLWGLTEDQLAHAFGIAGSASSGVLASLSGSAASKGLHAGWAAHGGVIAADLARRGATGPQTIFEGPLGFFDAFLSGEDVDLGRLTRGLGLEWETTRIAIRPYAASDFVHAFMDAAVRTSLKWADIEEIACFVAPAAVPIVCEPRSPRLHPATTHVAQYSLPFAVATAIVGGREDLDLFGDEARTDRRVLALAERIRHIPDPTLPFPHAFGGRMTIVTRTGREIEVEELLNRGHPDRPLPDDAVDAKFMRCARPRLDIRAARRALYLFSSLESSERITDLADALRCG